MLDHHDRGISPITFLTVVSDSKTSVTSATLTQIWPSHIDLSLVPPFPSTTTTNSRPNSYGGYDSFSSQGYYCAVLRHEFISLSFQLISSDTSPEYVLVDQTCFFNSRLHLHPFYSNINTIFRFFPPFPYFFPFKKVHSIQCFVITLSSAEGPVEDAQVLQVAPGSTWICRVSRMYK